MNQPISNCKFVNHPTRRFDSYAFVRNDHRYRKYDIASMAPARPKQVAAWRVARTIQTIPSRMTSASCTA